MWCILLMSYFYVGYLIGLPFYIGWFMDYYVSFVCCFMVCFTYLLRFCDGNCFAYVLFLLVWVVVDFCLIRGVRICGACQLVVLFVLVVCCFGVVFCLFLFCCFWLRVIYLISTLNSCVLVSLSLMFVVSYLAGLFT